MGYLYSILLVALITHSSVTAYQAPIIKGDVETIVPNSYVIDLNCTLEYHFKNLGVSKEQPPFSNVTDLTDFIDAYTGYFTSVEIDKIRSDPCVIQVSSNHFFKTSKLTSPTPVARHSPLSKRQQRRWEEEEEWSVPWNLVMASMHDKRDDLFKLRNSKNQGEKYNYVRQAGRGVDVYIIEAGMNREHEEIKDQTELFVSYEDRTQIVDDDTIHGTHVASIVAGKTYGIAKSANVRAVIAHEMADFLHALASIWREHRTKHANNAQYPGFAGSVINTSMGLAHTIALADHLKAATQLQAAGVLWVSAADNIDRALEEDPTPFLPCMLDGVLCVGAVDKYYNRASFTGQDSDQGIFSSRGMPVNVWGPGKNVIGGGLGEKLGSNPLHIVLAQGGSAAAPHVAGVAAIMLGYEASQGNINMRRDVFSLKQYIFANCKWSYLNDSDGPRGIGRTGKNFLINTGINDRKGSLKPFAEPNVDEQLSQQLAMVDTERGVQNRAFHHSNILTSSVRCFTDPGAKRRRVRWNDANLLWLALRWNTGHLHFHNGSTTSWGLLTPCINGACVYLISNERKLFFEPDTNFERHLLHIMMACKDTTVRGDFTGGYMKLEGLPNITIHLCLEEPEHA